MTKNMAPDRMVACMETGVFDMKPTSESLMVKEKNRALRKNTKSKMKRA